MPVNDVTIKPTEVQLRGKPVASKNKGGRPTIYTKRLGEKICERIASGESVNSICRSDGMPSKATVMRWLLSDSPKFKWFCDQYAKARRIQYELMADEITDICDDGRNDYVEREDGTMAVNSEVVARSRLRVDTRKWFLSKVLPKFSDKEKENDKDKMADLVAALLEKMPN